MGPGAPIRGPCTTWPHWTPPDCWREWIPPDGSATRSISAGGGDHTAQEAPKGELDEKAKEENRSVNKIRQVVERTIAHIKSWRILHTPYRRPLETFEQTITAALALYSFKTTP